MKNNKFIITIMAMILLTGCGNADNNEKVNEIINNINTIGNVEISDKDLIESIERDYNALTDKQKKQVTNYDTFLIARGELNVISGMESSSVESTNTTIQTDQATTTTEVEEYYDIPELVGMDFEEAKSILEEFGMIVTRKDEFSDDVAENYVIKYPHRKFNKDRNEITLTVSKGKGIWINSLFWNKNVKSAREAADIIEKEGISAKIEYVIENLKKYNIESPEEDIVGIEPNKAQKGETVTIKAIKPPIKISNVEGKFNTANGFELNFSIQNLTEEQIAYVYIDCYFYDTMGNKINCEVTNKNHTQIQVTGPLNAGSTKECYYDPIIYNSTLGAFQFKNITVEYTNGETQNISNQSYFSLNGYYGGELHN